MDERSAQHAAKRGSDKAKKSVHPRRGAAPAGRNCFRKERRQQRLVETVAKEKRTTAHVKKESVARAEQIDAIPEGDGKPPDENRNTKMAAFFRLAHVRKHQQHARHKDNEVNLPELRLFEAE